MGDEAGKKTGGRPESAIPRHAVEIRNVDPITFRMLGDLVAYGRFGVSKPEVALFIVRTWLIQNEEYLRTAILSREAPLGLIRPTAEPEE